MTVCRLSPPPNEVATRASPLKAQNSLFIAVVEYLNVINSKISDRCSLSIGCDDRDFYQACLTAKDGVVGVWGPPSRVMANRAMAALTRAAMCMAESSHVSSHIRREWAQGLESCCCQAVRSKCGQRRLPAEVAVSSRLRTKVVQMHRWTGGPIAHARAASGDRTLTGADLFGGFGVRVWRRSPELARLACAPVQTGCYHL